MSEFKPIKPDKVVISVRINSDLLKKLDKVSAETEMSRNEFINQCIRFALKNYNQK